MSDKKKYDNNNIFAQIIKGELSCKKVYENDSMLAFYDKYPDAPIHILVIPKNQYISYDDFILNAPTEEIINFFKRIVKIIHKHNLEKTGYRLVTNYGKNGEQIIPHFHIHILGGRKLGKHVNNL
ncbi:MAG: HIT domain-containing protein [Wolbachia endosymbiont of Menacanthus eurysternus]|nr:MAG: HIT domain-containing protein [Wolbachia endosymbiont of Menacanthus eurysternus]